MKDVSAPMYLKLEKSNIKILILGFDHRMKYDQSPEIIAMLSEVNILFQEGENGLIGPEPLKHLESLANGNENKWWLEISPEQQNIVQDLLDQYCTNFSYNKHLASKLTFSAIYQILDNIDYWYKTIHPKLYSIFHEKEKAFINLDSYDSIPEEHFNETDFIKLLNSCKNYIAQENQNISQNLNLTNAIHEIESLKQQEQNGLEKEGAEWHKEYIVDRNESWAEIILSNINSYDNLAISCGMVHIPGMLELLGEQGFVPL